MAFSAMALAACTVSVDVGGHSPPCAPGYHPVASRCVFGPAPDPSDGGPAPPVDGALYVDSGPSPDRAAIDGGVEPGVDAGPIGPPDRTCALAVRDPLAPVVLFTDLASGPNEGGQDDLGVFVTLYGLRFGAARDSSVVTYGGVEVARYVAWGQPTPVARDLEAVVVQIGGTLPNGPHEFVMSVNGRSSNPLSFTLRGGDIHFVDPNRSGPGDGSAAAPWNSLYQARGIGIVHAGATVYIKSRLGGPIETIDPLSAAAGNTANLRFESSTSASGTPDAPIAYVGYPGSYPTIGGDPSYVDSQNAQYNRRSSRAIWFPEGGPHATDYVIANMTLGRTRQHTLEMSGPGRRIVAVRHIDNIAQFEEIAGVGTQRAAVLGNYGAESSGDFIWFWSNVSAIELGWNEIVGSRFAAAFHIGGFGPNDPVSGVSVHDNLVDAVGGPAFFFGHYSSVVNDARVYNNVVRRSNGAAAFLEQDANRLGSVSITNNTFFRAGPVDYASSVGDAARWIFRNNILTVTQTTPEYYLAGTTQGVGGDHNLYIGASAATVVPDPTDRIVEDPRFVDADGADVGLGAGSRAVDTGVATDRCSDFFGVARPQGVGWDRGAIETR